MTIMERASAARLAQVPDGEAPIPASPEIGHLSAARSRMASEVGAAMAHELSGPMTALLLYVGDIHRKRNRIIDRNGDSDSLKRLVENAFREAERIAALLHRIGDHFDAPIAKETAIPRARHAIAWWSQAGGVAADAGHRVAMGPGRRSCNGLTPREREVLRLVTEGCSNKIGAKQMSISYRTFECHRAEVMRKLGAKNTAELVRFALLDPTGCSVSREPCNS